MHIVIQKEQLAHLLYLTNSIVEKRNTMPILANVKLSAENKTFQVTATDLEVSLVGQTAADVKTAGSITVGAKFLYEIIREAPGEVITLKSSKGERLEIDAGAARFKVNGIASDEFPSVAGVEIKNPVPVEAATLYEMLEKTAYAVSVDETRYNINGVLIERAPENGSDSCLRFVATDGHRLAMIDRPADGLDIDAGVILPRKGVTELKRLLEENDGAANVGLDNGFFTVESNGITMGIRLIDGEFPDYQQVLPDNTTANIVVDKNDLLSALKRVSLVTTDKSRGVRLKAFEQTLSISSSSPEFGEASESLSVKHTGEDVNIGFSAKYAIELLASMQGAEMVTVSLNGESGPGVFVGDDDEAYTCVVMPMRFE